MIGTRGDPLGVRVVPADTQDRDALHTLAPDPEARASLLLVWLDRDFAGDNPAAFLHARCITGEVVGTPDRRGFQVKPRRWKVEQTFGCLQRYRRLRVDDEAGLGTSRHMSVLASVSMTGMRLERSSGDKSFRQAPREPKLLSEIKQEQVVPIHTEDGSNWQKGRARALRRGPLALCIKGLLPERRAWTPPQALDDGLPDRGGSCTCVRHNAVLKGVHR